MSKTFFTVGATTTQSIDSHQPVWALLPETTIAAVTSTYARHVYPGTKVLLWLGSVRNIFQHHFLPHLTASAEHSLAELKPEYAAVRGQIDAFAGNSQARAQIFLSYLSNRRQITYRLDPVIDKIAQHTPLTRKDTLSLVEAVCSSSGATTALPTPRKEQLQGFIETGDYDTETMLWLALGIDPRFVLHLWKDDLVESAKELSGPPADLTALQHELRRAIEKLRNGGACAKEVGGVDFEAWLAALIGGLPRQRFFVEASECHEGLNRNGCLNFDVSSSFRDFGEAAPRFIALDKLSRAVTAFDRTLSHLVIRFAQDDPEMRQLSDHHLLHSGMLVRGLVGDNDAMRVLYPTHSTNIPNRSALSDQLVERTRAAVTNGALADVCARHYGLSTLQLQRGIERLLAIQRKTLPLLPAEVHQLVDAIESRLRLRKAAEALEANGGRTTHRHQTIQLEISERTQATRQFALAKRLKADFHIDPTRLFYIDNLLIDRIKALYGSELEFMRTILAGYIERREAPQPHASPAVNS